MEDAFLAALLDAPADEAARLAYADWLDERGDRRCACLRAEVAYFHAPAGARAATAERLEESRRGIDPTWAARVSRPPLGVCCDAVRFLDIPGMARPRLSPESLTLLESWLETELPPAYRAFLLNYNGGSPQPNRLVLPGGVYREVQYLLSVFNPDGQPLDHDFDLVVFAEDHLVGHPPLLEPGIGILTGSIKIGVCVLTGEGDTLCLGFVGERRGQVLLVDPGLGRNDEPTVTPVAASFPEFLAMLH